jgi:lactate permease
MLIFAILPLLVLIFLLLVLKWSLARSAPLAFAVTAMLAAFKWNAQILELIQPLFKGGLLAIDVSLIIFGAIFFVEYLKREGHFLSMLDQLNRLTQDREKLVLLFAWLFGSFIEGVSGFGTAGAIVAPFLVGIGIDASKAIVISLIANCTAVTFGAVGTPIRIGMADFLDVNFIQTVWQINLLPALMIPFVILFYLDKGVVKKNWSFALLVGLSFIIPYALVTNFGYEYPSIVGGAVGFCTVLFILKHRASDLKWSSFIRAFSPYLLLLFILFLGKFVFEDFYSEINLGKYLKHNIQLFNPGLAFITTTLILILTSKKPVFSYLNLAEATFSPLAKTFMSIFFVSSLTYTMVLTDRLVLTEYGMLESIASHASSKYLQYYSAFIGAFGAFLAGSATVSNLLFTEMQVHAAKIYHIKTEIVLALQLTGAAAGNMIALPNILAIQAAVKQHGGERELLLQLIWPCLFYLILATLCSLNF